MFDEIDLNIMRALQKDGALSQTSLARIAGASAASCWRRIKALESAGVLGPLVRLLDQEAVNLGVNVFCSIRLKNHLPKTSECFEKFVITRPEIVECFEMTGEWDYLLRIVTSDISTYERLLRRFILANEAVASASSNFALSKKKFTTFLPI